MHAGKFKRHRAGHGRRAIIDIGSNTVRLVIFGSPLRAPVTLLNEKVTAKLGKGVAENGRLSQKSMKIALEALARFVILLEAYEVNSVITVATAAVRDAKNGDKFLAAVSQIGLSPQLLSGEQEAIASARGVVGAFAKAKGVVADLGGGSLELVHVEHDQCEHGISLPLGTLCLGRFHSDATIKPATRIAKIIKDAKWRCPPGETLYLVGGSHRAFAKLAMQKLQWPIDDPHGFELDPATAARTIKAVLKAKAPLSVDGVSAARLACLHDTAMLLSILLKTVRPGRLVFSSWGLREGLLYSELTPQAAVQDPLLAAVADFADNQGASALDATMVAGWTSAANPITGIDKENLRLAATMLALAAQGIESNLRLEQACQWALRKRWIGITAQDRAMIAACMIANAGRNVSQFPQLARLASPEHLDLAEIWGMTIRLCRRFSGTSVQVLAGSRISIENGALLLTVQAAYSPLYKDAAAKDLTALAGKLDLKPVFQVTD
jgi:exopolyphosphatase/guanosine-5'-triphosphate,3'-diphosphate pyrophosphatase